MTNDELREILDDLDIVWFFKPNDLECLDARDLLDLPPKYHGRIEAFVSSHSGEELREYEIKDFIEQATGESYDKVMKLINVEKKKQSIEQDFN